MKFQNFVLTFIILLVLKLNNTALAETSSHPEMGKEKITQLIKKALPDAPHHNGMMLTVDFLPGQGAIPHKHPGSVFAYVLEGSVISQLEGQKPITYTKGQYWYEPPMIGHIICKNASNEYHAKLLVWQLLGDKDVPLIPLQKSKNAYKR